MERIGGPAAPTAVEKKWQDGGTAQAEPTVLERQVSMAPTQKKSNMAMIIGIAAVVVIAIVIGVFVMMKKQTTTVATTTSPTPGTQVTTTAPTNLEPIAGGNGALLLSASPWGDVEKIVNAKDNSAVPLPVDTSTPARIDLKPGTYKVTIAGPSGTKDVNVEIEAGKRTPQHVNMGNVNVDDLAKEMNQP